MLRKPFNFGFTLVEMLVVIVIASVLMAIGMAVFKSSTSKARQAAAISTLQAAAVSATERAAETSSFPDPNTVKGNLAYDEPQLDPQTGNTWSDALLPAYKNSVVVVNTISSNPAGLTMYSRTTTGDVVEMVIGPKGEQKASLIKDLIGKTPTLVSKPSVSGSFIVGQQLTANAGGWISDTNPSFDYQWQRCNIAGTTCTDIGTNSSTYIVVPADVGNKITVKITARNTTGTTAVPAVSTIPNTSVSLNNATGVPRNTAQPVISGTPKQGVVTSASAGTWINNLSTFDYQWYRCDASGNNCVIIAGAAGTNIPSSPAPTFNYTPVVADVASTLRIQVVGKDSLGNSSMAQSNASPLVQGAAPVNTSQPTLVGSAAEGQTISTTNGTWSNAPTGYTYQWQRCLNGVCNDIASATASSYLATSSDFNNQLRAKVTATNAYGSTVAITDPSAPVAGVAPVNNTLPTITGTVKDGQTVTINNGSWTGTPTITYTYQWQISSNNSTWSDLSGQTASTYAIPYNTYTAQWLRTRVTASNAVGTTVTSSNSSQISAAAPVNTSIPTVSGTAQDGQTLTTTNGAWTGTATITYTYQWQYSNDGSTGWTNIAAATSNTYTITPTQVTKYIRSQVTGTNSAGSSSAVSSASSQVTSIPVSNSAPPTFTGTAQDGSTLTASPGTWAGTPTITYAYQWQRSANGTSGWVNIASATSSTYTLTSSDYANYVRVQVVGSNAYTNATAYSSASAQIAPLAPSNSVAPALSGSAQDGQTLTTGNGTWTGTPTITYTYQWQTSANGSTGWANLGGATSSSYVVQTADVGNYLRACVTGTNPGGTASSCSSASSQVISSIPVGAVIAYAGNTTPAGWAVADGTCGYTSGANAALWASIGSTYGGTSSNFCLPDMRGRFALGKAASGTGSTLGGSGGALDQSGSVNPWGTQSVSFSWSESVSAPAAIWHDHSYSGYANTPCCGGYVYTGQAGPGYLNPNNETFSGGGSVSPSASGSVTPSATYSVANPGYKVVKYLIATVSGASPPCGALWGSGRSSAPTGAALADGSAATGGFAACENAAYSGAIPDMRGRMPLGQGLSGSSSTLAAAGGNIDQSVSANLSVASTTTTVNPGSWSFSATEGSHSHSWANSTRDFSADGSAGWKAAEDTPLPSIGGNSNGGSAYSSNSYAPGALATSSSASASAVTSAVFQAPFQSINWLVYTAASYQLDPGTITPFAGSSVPSGWVLADGACYATTGQYANLFSALGYTFGGGGASFCVPDLRGRFALGKAAAGTGSSLGSSGGTIAPAPALSFPGWSSSLTVPAHTFSWSIGSHYHAASGFGTNGYWPSSGGGGGIISTPWGGNSDNGGGGVTSASIGSNTVAGPSFGVGNVSPAVSPPSFLSLNYLVKY